MGIDRKILLLFALPCIGALLGMLAYMAVPTETNFVPDRPEFLTYVDQLTLYTSHVRENDNSEPLQDVFLHNTPGEEPVTVSMIVKNGSRSYVIIDGRKMNVGDTTEAFTLMSIDRNSVTVAYQNGTRETLHVKGY